MTDPCPRCGSEGVGGVREAIKENKKRMWYAVTLLFGFGFGIIAFGIYFTLHPPNPNYNPILQTIFISLAIAFGAGLSVAVLSTYSSFQTTTRLIQLEYKLLDAINKKESKDD